MHLDPLWLFLAAPFGSALAASLGHGVQAALYDSSSDLHAFQSGQIPLSESHAIFSHGQDDDKEPEDTIYETIAKDPEFSRLTKALNFVEDVASLLKDSSSDLTFFAVPDHALRRPDRPPPGAPPGSPPPHDPRHPPHGPTHGPPHGPPSNDLAGPPSSSHSSALKRAIDTLDADNYIAEFGNLAEALDLFEEFQATAIDDKDDDHEKRKKIFKIILRAILHYHIIPTEAYDVVGLARNTTYPTKLAIPGALDGKPLRLRVSHRLIPPSTTVNFFSRISRPNVKATNGIVHVLSHPLIPPPPVFQELYLAPRFFSTFTSVLQRSELTKDLDLRFVRGKGLSGTSLVTVFAPTNRAFEALPPRLQLFLFSPFGERVLKKLLEYHIVPDVVVHSNYIHHTKALKAPELSAVLNETLAHDLWDILGSRCGCGCPPRQQSQKRGLKAKVWTWISRITPGGPRERDHHHQHHKLDVKPIISANLTLDTLFTNHTLHAHIAQNEITFPFPGPKKPSIVDTKVFVNGHAVVVADVVGLNGVVHVVDRLLDPRKKHASGHHGHHGHHHHHHGHGPHHGHPRHPDPVAENLMRELSRTVNNKSPKGKDSGHHGHQLKHHRVQINNVFPEDTWNDWEDWLVQWADAQN